MGVGVITIRAFEPEDVAAALVQLRKEGPWGSV